MPALESLPRKIGPYRVLEKIGEGGMGVVYLAADAKNRKVAVKVLGPAVAGDPNARRRLSREVETMRRVHNPHVAEILAADVTGSSPYIVTRYVPGRTLEKAVREDGPLRGAALDSLATGLAEALAAIHAAGVVHRDLKPGNVMLDGGQPVVIDFGIAHIPDATRLTKTGLVMGTPGYLAPELIEGQPSSGASDVHSWGATVAFAATGRQPFGEGSYQTVFFRVLRGNVDVAGIPAGLEPLVTAALSVDPRSRPSARWLAGQCAAPGTSRSDVGPAGTRVQGTLPLRPEHRVPAYQSPAQAAADLADLLPPVSYAGPAAAASRSPLAGSAGAPAGRASGHGLVGLAVALGAIALAVLLPVAGTVVVLAVITALRAADMAQADLAGRRRLRGERSSDVLVVIVTAPWTFARAAVTSVMHAPLAIGAASVAWVASIVFGRADMPVAAIGWAAGGAVAWYCAAPPGARAPRRQVRRMSMAVIRSRGAMIVAIISTTALALAVASAALSQPPLLWPLPGSAVPHVLSAVQGWLLRHTMGMLHVP